MDVKVLFLDYDGVIADSMGAKVDAMADAFAPYTQDRAAVADGFRRHAGSGRELVFDRIYEDLLGKPLDEPTRANISWARFSTASTASTRRSVSSPASMTLSKARRRSGSSPW